MTKEQIMEQSRGLLQGLSEKELEEYAQWMADKYTTVKRGPNVVHLQYYGGVISKNDLAELSNRLADENLELSSFDNSGVPQNSLRDFVLEVFLAISNPIVQNVLLGIGTSALWDAIKLSMMFVWRKAARRNEKESVVSNSEHQPNVGIMFRHGDTTCSFILKNVSEVVVSEAIDKTLNTLKSLHEQPNSNAAEKRFKFNESEGVWEEIDLMEEFRKMREQQARRRSGNP